MRKLYLLFILLFAFAQVSFAQVSIPGTSFVEISFDATLPNVNNGTFAGLGFQPNPGIGLLDSDAWAVAGLSDGDMDFGGSEVNFDFARGTSTGGISAGGIYSFQVATGNYALGVQPNSTDDWIPGSWTLKAINNSGDATTAINISYEIWTNNDKNSSSSMIFSYSTDNITYTDISSLDYATPGDADEVFSWVKTDRNTKITVAISDGSLIYFKWTGDDILPSGRRDEYAIDNIRISIDDEPVPVELISFTAEALAKGVKLNWSTATEVNNYGFDVEKKAAGNWEKISFIEGHGNSNSPKDYSFVDKAAIVGEVSYRLKQVDTDGAFEYSDVVAVTSVNLAKNELLQNHPNPFNPSTAISFSLAELAHVKITVYNAIGQKVMELANEQMDAGNHKVNFDGSNLSSGFYFYRLETPNYSKTMKMILLR